MRFRYSAESGGKPVKKALVYTQDEHGINFSDVDEEAVYITGRLKSNGYDAYVVGGAVRDLILGKKPKDFDIVTAANPSGIKRIFRNSRIIGRRFRLVQVYFGQKIYEVSTFRSIKDGPTSNTFGTIEEDVRRRDFTLNALFYDPQKQIVVDYVGGMKDIRARKVRPIIPLREIFTDDPVRMIRAVKYGASTGFILPLSLRLKIRAQSGLLESVSPSRLTEELFKILHSSSACSIVNNLDELGLYRYLQPEAARLFKSLPGFKERYLKTMGKLNVEGFKNLPGEALSALVRDYLEDEADWDGLGSPRGEVHESPQERYKEAFILARKFVLPMNPPRMELDHAVRLMFSEHGVTIKKSRFTERTRRRVGTSLAPEESAGAGAETPDKTEAPPKRKNRRRRKPSAPKEAGPLV